MKILLIEDDADIASNIGQYFEDRGHRLDFAYSGTQGLELALGERFDLLILDLMLPGKDGVTLCREFRERSQHDTPVLMLTARDTLDDKVGGFEAGADDYLVKPFHHEEMMARIRVLIRRASGWSDSRIVCAPVSLDTATQRTYVGERELDLTAYEYRVLEYLMLHAGEVISKTMLTEHLYDDERDNDSNVIEVFIRRLRQKLDPDETLKPIETLRGRGYRFTLARAERN